MGFTTEARRAQRLTEESWGEQHTHKVLAVLCALCVSVVKPKLSPSAMSANKDEVEAQFAADAG
jgi:hypothetical protein